MNISYLIPLLLLVSACNLEVKPENEISGDAIINTIPKAESLLSQAYVSLQFSPEDYSILTEDFQPTYLISYQIDLQQYHAWNEAVIERRTAQIWEANYNALVHLNTLLNSEPYLNSAQDKWSTLKGQALVLKAYIYFDLLQLFSKRYDPQEAGIILKESNILATNPRLTQAESLKAIENFLSEAVALLKDNNDTQIYYMQLPAAYLLQGQVALFQKKYAEAEERIAPLLAKNKSLPQHKDEIRMLWNNSLTAQSPHVLWAYDYRTHPNNYLYYTNRNEGDYFQVNNLFSFEEQDLRATISLFKMEMKTLSGQTGVRPLFGKYRSTLQDQLERMPVMMRLTEAHFILLESLVEQNKLPEAVATLNRFFTSVGLTTIPNQQSQQSLRLRIRHEKQKEFIGEKINFLDLKRWNKSISRYLPDSNTLSVTIQASDYRWTWPIPTSERRYNTLVRQNPGWLF